MENFAKILMTKFYAAFLKCANMFVNYAGFLSQFRKETPSRKVFFFLSLTHKIPKKLPFTKKQLDGYLPDFNFC